MTPYDVTTHREEYTAARIKRLSSGHRIIVHVFDFYPLCELVSCYTSSDIELISELLCFYC
ncbi:unnamed protein product [Larinioides sclopetarius]|uniref:Uncharacterized protein n=1 Tax=Larinioides sclopetarius TaxID=280406 RepID=A0AAV2BBX1_9ARAC